MASSILSNPHREIVPGQITVEHDERVFAVIQGRRWTRVAEYLSNGQLTAAWFVDEATSEVRMADGWKSPSRYPGRRGPGRDYVLAIVAKARESRRPSTEKCEVYLTSEQSQRLWAVDKEWIGSDHYMGLAYFWNYEYRFHLRDASAFQRVRVHRALLDAGLDLEGESPEHLAVIERIAPIR